MIDVKAAVQAASRYFQSIQGLVGIDNPPENLQLEEVEISEDRNFWLITLGFERLVRGEKHPLVSVEPPPKYERAYKLFRVNAETGEVEAMKIREV